MQTITKEKIATKIEESLGLSKVICEELVTQIFNSALNILSKNYKLKIKNFGSFEIIQKVERPGMNMQTLTPIIIKARKIIMFSPSRNFKKKLNKND